MRNTSSKKHHTVKGTTASHITLYRIASEVMYNTAKHSTRCRKVQCITTYIWQTIDGHSMAQHREA